MILNLLCLLIVMIGLVVAFFGMCFTFPGIPWSAERLVDRFIILPTFVLLALMFVASLVWLIHDVYVAVFL